MAARKRYDFPNSGRGIKATYLNAASARIPLLRLIDTETGRRFALSPPTTDDSAWPPGKPEQLFDDVVLATLERARIVAATALWFSGIDMLLAYSLLAEVSAEATAWKFSAESLAHRLYRDAQALWIARGRPRDFMADLNHRERAAARGGDL
ncbi:MAG: hypothetical protein ACYCXG_11840 [Acidiferrobacter sp.]